MDNVRELERLQEHVKARVQVEGLRPLAARLGVEVGVLRSAQVARDMKFTNLKQLLDALGWSVRIAPNVTMSVDQAEGFMGEFEGKLSRHVPGPSGLGNEDHTRLTAIACDEDLPDRVRTRADLILRHAFSDPDADHRQAERSRRLQGELERAEIVVSDAIANAGWMPPPELHGHLMTLARHYQVDAGELTHLLFDMRRMVGLSPTVDN